MRIIFLYFYKCRQFTLNCLFYCQKLFIYKKVEYYIIRTKPSKENNNLVNETQDIKSKSNINKKNVESNKKEKKNTEKSNDTKVPYGAIYVLKMLEKSKKESNKTKEEKRIDEINEKLARIKKAINYLKDNVVYLRKITTEKAGVSLEEPVKNYCNAEKATWGEILKDFENDFKKLYEIVESFSLYKDNFSENNFHKLIRIIDNFINDGYIRIVEKKFYEIYSYSIRKIENELEEIDSINEKDQENAKEKLKNLVIEELEYYTGKFNYIKEDTKRMIKIIDKFGIKYNVPIEQENIILTKEKNIETNKKENKVNDEIREEINKINRKLEKIEKSIVCYKELLVKIKDITTNKAGVLLNEIVESYDYAKKTTWERILNYIEKLFKKVLENVKSLRLKEENVSVEYLKILNQIIKNLEVYCKKMNKEDEALFKITREILNEKQTIDGIKKLFDELNPYYKDENSDSNSNKEGNKDSEDGNSKKRLRLYAIERLKDYIKHFGVIDTETEKLLKTIVASENSAKIIKTKQESDILLFNGEFFGEENKNISEKERNGEYKKSKEINSLTDLTKKCKVTCNNLNDFLEMTDDFFTYHRFDDQFLNRMACYKEDLLSKECGDINEVPPIEENNKDINDLRNRIGLIYYLYDNNQSKDIKKEDVNNMSILYNEILDAREFLNIYYYFKKYIRHRRFTKEPNGERIIIPHKKTKEYLERDDYNRKKAQELLFNFINNNYLNSDKIFKKEDKNKQQFLELYKTFYEALFSIIKDKTDQLYSILGKGNEKINLIKTKTPEIEKAFRTHLYAKGNFDNHNNNIKFTGVIGDCRLLNAEKNPNGDEFEKVFDDTTYKISYNEIWLYDYFKEFVLKEFNKTIKTEDLEINLKTKKNVLD